jgi:hypothetical protein
VASSPTFPPGRLFARTTNPVEATGDGLALAWRAGARVADVEFVQFHPTALETGADPMPLLTEALRGAGSRLVDEEGRPLSSASVGFETVGGQPPNNNLVDRLFDTSGGSFRFDHLSPGTYVLIAKAPDRPDVISQPIQVEPGKIVRGVPMVFLPAKGEASAAPPAEPQAGAESS